MLTHSDHLVSCTRERVQQIQAERERLAAEVADGATDRLGAAPVDSAAVPAPAPARRPRRLALLRLL